MRIKIHIKGKNNRLEKSISLLKVTFNREILSDMIHFFKGGLVNLKNKMAVAN